MAKNAIRTSKSVASKASKQLKTAKSNVAKSVAGAALVNRKKKA